MNNYNHIEEELDHAGEVSPVSPMVWYDTEQSRSSTKGILSDRISQLANNNTDMDTRLFVFNVCNVNRANREAYFLAAIEHYKPDLVILDGIRDLVSDINDGPAAQEILSNPHEASPKIGVLLSGGRKSLGGRGLQTPLFLSHR